MVPINIFSKLVTSRSQIVFARKHLVTSSAFWRERGDCPDKSMNNPQCGRKRAEDNCPGDGLKKQKQGCCPKNDPAKCPEIHNVTRQKTRESCGALEEHERLEAKKQGEGSSCGPVESSDKCLKGKQQRTRNLSASESVGKQQGSRGCSCPPYDTPKCVKESDIKKEQRGSSGCPENNVPKHSKGAGKCAPDKRRTDPCENRNIPRDECQKRSPCAPQADPCGSINTPRQNKCPENDKCRRDECKKITPCASQADPCGPINTPQQKKCPEKSPQNDKCRRDECQKRSPCAQKVDPCGSINTPRRNKCPEESPENDKCRRDKCKNRHDNYCGPKISSSEGSCKEDNCKADKQIRDGPCEATNSSNRNYRDNDKNPCTPSKVSSKNACSDEECPDICKERNNPCRVKKSSLSNCPNKKNECEENSDPCNSADSSSKRLCLEECENSNPEKPITRDPCKAPPKNDCPEECSKEQKQNVCPENDPCKKDIKIPEVSQCCKIDKAKECICQLKELQRQWEEVVAAQEDGGKDDCPKNQKLGKKKESVKKGHKRSNMIYVVLGAILSAVVYFIYNEDLEPSELFLENEEVIKVIKDDNDEED